jgi:hypothetical protein
MVRHYKRVVVKRHYRRVPVVLVRSRTQSGTSRKPYDKRRHALAPGKRRSKTGHIYYEKRKNRSDKGKWL